MGKNGFLKHFAIIGSGTFVSMVFGLLTTPIITRIVDPVEYGQLSIFTMYSQIGLMVLCMGLDQTVVRYYYEQNDTDYKRSLLFHCIKLPVIVSVLASVLFISITATGILKFEFDTLITVWLCFYTIVQIIYRFSLLIVRLEYNSRLYSMLSIVQKIAYIVIVLPLVFMIQKDYLLILVWGTVFSLILCMVISIFAQAKMWNFFENRKEACTVPQKELLCYAYPYIISMSVTTLFQTIDTFSLNIFCSYKEVGIYSSTMTLIRIFSMVQITFNTLWAPMAVKHYTKDHEDRTFYKKGNSVITVVMFFIGICLILFKDVFAILLGDKYREAAYILPFLIFSPIMYTVSETTVNGLVFMKKSGMQIVVALGACVTNIIGNVILVPKLGAQGAAISTGFSYIVFFALRTILSNRYYYVDFMLKKYFLLTFVVVLYALYNTFIKFNVGSVGGFIVCMVVLIVLYKDTVVWGIQYLWKMCRDLLESKHETR